MDKKGCNKKIVIAKQKINKINIVASIDKFGSISDKFVALNRWHLIYINLYPDIDKFGALRILVALKLFVPNKMFDANQNFNYLTSDDK